MNNQQIITIVISVIALLISMASIAISVLMFLLNKKSTKAALLHQVKVSIDSAKTQVENRIADMAELDSKNNRSIEEEKQYQTLLSVRESAFEKVLNAYEDGCQKYLSDLILKDEFRKSYFHDIRNFVTNFVDKFSGPVTGYTSILKVYNEWHRPE